jgi:ubiquinone/menaquinone biosynthesis C-methylase UbiE
MTLGMPQAWDRVAGNYRRHILPDFLPAARRLCREVNIGPRDRVLDVACGPGTAVTAALELGAAEVVGADYSAGMVRVAREESGASRGARFLVANALALPLATGHFDVVVSSFGLIFAPDPVLAAREAARVLKPGGRLGLLVWPPDGSVGAYQRAVFRGSPDPPGTHDAFRWGVPEQAASWLGSAVTDLVWIPLEVPFEAPSPTEAWRVLRTATGRVAAAYEALDPAARRRLDADMERFFEPLRRPDGRVCWPREAAIVKGVRA